jgi:dCTP diphosphatase
MMEQRLIDTRGLEAALAEFAEARNWGRFHSPKNLAMALAGEVGELIELFQWLTEDESRQLLLDPKKAQSVRDEIADVAIYLVRLASVLGVDLNEAVMQKVRKNEVKYPAT